MRDDGLVMEDSLPDDHEEDSLVEKFFEVMRVPGSTMRYHDGAVGPGSGSPGCDGDDSAIDDEDGDVIDDGKDVDNVGDDPCYEARCCA